MEQWTVRLQNQFIIIIIIYSQNCFMKHLFNSQKKHRWFHPTLHITYTHSGGRKEEVGEM